MTARVAAILSDRLGNGNRAALARATGIDRTLLTRMLDGKKAITVEEFVAICRALRITPQTVIGQATTSPGKTVTRTKVIAPPPRSQAEFDARVERDIRGIADPKE